MWMILERTCILVLCITLQSFEGVFCCTQNVYPSTKFQETSCIVLVWVSNHFTCRLKQYLYETNFGLIRSLTSQSPKLEISLLPLWSSWSLALVAVVPYTWAQFCCKMWGGAAWCETNILRNLKSKMWGTWHIISPLSEKVGEKLTPCPPPNCAHDHIYYPPWRDLPNIWPEVVMRSRPCNSRELIPSHSNDPLLRTFFL